MAGTPLGKMADQTIVESVHNSDHGAFASGASRGGSLKESDSSPLVSPTAIINMSRGQFNVDVAATFGVLLTNVGDLDELIKDIEDGNHEELLSEMTNNMCEATMDALVLLWLKNLNVDESLIFQFVSIQDKHGSYIDAAGGSRPKPSATGGSKLDQCISKANFCLLFSENLCEGVYVSIRRKFMETDVLKESLTIGVHLIEDTGFTIKTVSIPITIVTPVVHAPIVEMTNDGFQTMGKKKKGESKSINGGQIGGHLVKHNVRDIENEVVRLMMFPLSLTREANTWLGELNEGTIKTWDELRTTFISRFFPPALFDRLLGEIRAFSQHENESEIRAFSQHENESLTDALASMKNAHKVAMVNNPSKGNIIKIFYHGLTKITQEVLNAAAGGIFLYKTPNQAYQLLEDKVLLKLDWAKNQKTKSSLKKTVAFADEGNSNSDTNKIMARMDSMTIKMDAQYKELQSRAKQPTPNLNDDDIPMSCEEEVKFMQTFRKTHFYNDYHDRDSNHDN
ncbi:reverse transcriptase domain-containing protein [Tanacetum coccineum]